MGLSLALWLAGHKQKYWTNQNVDVMMAIEVKTGDHQSYYNSPLFIHHECLNQSMAILPIIVMILDFE